MAYKVAMSNLNADTITILNTIRENADAEYQSMVPKMTPEMPITQVGKAICGYPAIANKFVSALINRIAAVVTKSALFYNPYKELKKGFLEYGETVEEVFVEIAKVREFSAEKAAARELRRSLPEVRAAFHAINWRVQYPITVQMQDLQRAFLSLSGVQDLIAKIVDSVYRAAEYDEFLLFKYQLIKGITSGLFKPIAIPGNPQDVKNAATTFRGISNNLTFMSTQYNAAGVHNVSPRDDQYIFMDSMYNAKFDVEVLASAYNMDKATFMGHLFLIDNWAEFDNSRWGELRDAGNMVDLVTEEELAIMKGVHAVAVDKEWFQHYDNLSMFTEVYVSSGLYWNYNYNVWKTVSASPFSNAVVFADAADIPELPATFTATITQKDLSENGTILVLTPQYPDPSFIGQFKFIQDEEATKAGIAVKPYGAYIFPHNVATPITPIATLGGTQYTGGTQLNPATASVGDTVTFTKAAVAAARIGDVKKATVKLTK